MIKKFISLFSFIIFLFFLSAAQTNKTGAVTIFYSTTCPICQKMTLTIRELQKQFDEKEIAFRLVFPSEYDTPTKIRRFVKTYQLKTTYATDYKKILVKQLNATVTPQAILTDNTGRILYSGKIDNWFEDIGKRRTIITEHYLQDAMNSYLKGEDIKVKKTDPVGCFIN